MERDAIAELEAWQSKDKAHSVNIYHDDGFGASCWMVELQSGTHMVETAEIHVGPDWPGLAKTILAAIDRAKELKL